MKVMMMILLLATLVTLQAACTETRFSGIVPIYPELQFPRGSGTVDTLQPELRWNRAAGLDVRYDVYVREGLKREDLKDAAKVLIFEERLLWEVGKKIAYAEGLIEPTYKLEKTLKPGWMYYWSVRVRRGGSLSQWHGYQHCLDWKCDSSRSGMFRFRTP